MPVLRKLIVLDPGGTTGVCIVGTGHIKMTTMFTTLNLGPHEHHKELWELLTREDPDGIICESFVYRAGLDRAELIPREYIGVVKLYCELTGTPYRFQSPAEGKAFGTDRKLKGLGLYKGRSPHERDAIRHALLFMSKKKNEAVLKALRDLILRDQDSYI